MKPQTSRAHGPPCGTTTNGSGRLAPLGIVKYAGISIPSDDLYRIDSIAASASRASRSAARPAAAEAARAGRSLTINGIHLSESGDALLAPEIFKTLFNEAAPALDTPAAQKIRSLITQKNAWWHSHYRTVDGYNVYGDRHLFCSCVPISDYQS